MSTGDHKAIQRPALLQHARGPLDLVVDDSQFRDLNLVEFPNLIDIVNDQTAIINSNRLGNFH